MNKHLIHLSQADLKKSIYRVFSIQRLIEICSSKKNTLVRPKKWDDPFENFILTRAIAAKQGRYPGITVQGNFYGQCWSNLEESDAMWRIYSPDKNGVKVKTTIGKLVNSLIKSVNGNGECFIGKVSYLEDSSLKNKLEDESWLLDEAARSRGRANALLYKREEFSHEHEVRLLYLFPIQTQDDLFSYSIEPLKLFDSIQFDPRISDELFSVYKHYLKTKVGFRRSINKSKLYQLPQLKTVSGVLQA
jgi:hypothetical protein